MTTRARTGRARRGGSSEPLERALAARPVGRSEYFALHCAKSGTATGELSTAAAPARISSVDELPDIGLVVPKRHARRAVSRNLVKRQVRHAFARHCGALAPGLWVVRLRSPLDTGSYPSAASHALRDALRAELDALFEAAA